MLAEVSKHVQAVEPRHMSPEQIFAKKEATFESSEGVEVFEVDDNDTGVGTPQVIDTNVNHKPRPNDICPCGSNKKYKKCCGAK